MHRLIAAILLSTAPAQAQERATFSLPEPISAYSGGEGVFFELPLEIPVPFAADERPDLVVGRADAPNPAARGVEESYQLARAAYEAALRAYEANVAARAAAQRALDTVYPVQLAAYEADLASWQLCQRQSLIPCGSRPTPPSRPRIPAALPLPDLPERSNVSPTIDTRSGPILDFAVAGETATLLNFSASLGTIDPSLVYDVSLQAPDPVPPGEPVQLTALANLVSGRIDGTSPTYRITLGQRLRIDRGEISAGACIALAGCAETDTAEADRGEAYVEILNITPQGTVFFGQTLPERFIRAGLPGLELEVSANLNIDADDTANPFGISVNGVSIPPELTVGVATEAATGRLEYPVLELPGALEDGVIQGRATSDFITLDIDVDTATGLIGGASIGNDLISAGADLWDINAGPRLRPYQNMVLTPVIQLTLQFDRPVTIEGRGEVTEWQGAPGDIPAIRLSENTSVTPIWSVTGQHEVDMGFAFLAEIVVQLIIAELNVSGGTIEFGPFAPEVPVMATDSIDMELVSNSFAVTGFTPFTGQPILLETGPDTAPLGVIWD